MKFNLYFLLSLFVLTLKAQDIPQFKYDNMLWLGYYNTIAFKGNWKIVSDAQIRTKDWAEHWSQGLIRTGLSKKLNDKFSVTAGLAHFRFFITDIRTRGEWRPWEEIAMNDQWKKWKITHRIRIEQRFNERVVSNYPDGEYIFNHRFRYKLDLQYPLFQKENKQLLISFGNEIMINAGKNIATNYFDQNRTSVGLTFDLNSKISFQAQYIYIWQQLSNGITLDKINVIRFNILHRINL